MVPPAESRSATVSAGAPTAITAIRATMAPRSRSRTSRATPYHRERDHERDDRHPVGREPRAEEHRRNRPARAIPPGREARGSPTTRPQTATIRPTFSAVYTSRLRRSSSFRSVSVRSGRSGERRRRPSSRPERPQAGGEPRRRHPEERAHRGERARPEQVRRAGVEAVQDELRDGRRVEGTPLERLRRHPPRVGQLEAVGPVSPRPEHLEVEERRAPQPDDGDRQEDDQARGDREPILRQLLAQRLAGARRGAPAAGPPPTARASPQEGDRETTSSRARGR